MKKTLFILLCVFLTGVYASAQNLVIDYQYNIQGPDSGNYLTFSGPHRMAQVNKDNLDVVTGASKQKSTALFSTGYQTDIAGKAAFPGGMRSLLLFPVASGNYRTDDSLNVTKAADGVITVQYVHRGVAYRVVTDAQGRLTFPKGRCFSRTIGFIQGTGAQVISRDFSSDGTAAKIDWAKVWDSKIQAGKDIPGASNVKTGAITNDWEDSTIFQWSGPLQFAFDGRILKISGSLRATRG